MSELKEKDKNDNRKSKSKYKGYLNSFKKNENDAEGENKAAAFLSFCKKNIRYLSAGILFLIIILVLAVVLKQPETEPIPEPDSEIETETSAITEEETEDYVKDAYPEINTLISKYYQAYADGKIKKLSKLAKPVSDTEKSYISVFSEYVKSYKNISCYTKKGLEEGSYIVSVYLEMKFKGIKTTAPGLDFFYVRTNEDGSLYIDNLYSQFNMTNKEQELNNEIVELIEEFEMQTDVIALQSEVQTKYEDAISSDEDLKVMVEQTVPDAITVWASEQVAAAKAEEEAKKAEEEAKKAEEEAAKKAAEEEAAKKKAEEKLAEEMANAVTVYATTKVNVRSKASETSDALGQLEAGAQTTRLEDKDGWSRINYSDGTQGYVKSEFLSTEKVEVTETEGESTGVNGFAEGTTIRLSESTNLRASMSTDSEKIATIFSGESVKVIFSYAEGWTKVSYGDKTGFVRTDLLK